MAGVEHASDLGEAHFMVSEAPPAAPAGGPTSPPPPTGGRLRALAVAAGADGLRIVVNGWQVLRAQFSPSDRLVGEGTAVVDPAERRSLVVRPAILGFLAVLAVAVGASLPSSPFKLEMPGVWFFGVPSTSAGSTWGVYFTLAAVYGGLVLFGRVWWRMTRLYHDRPGVPVRQMKWVFALWSLPMLVIAPLFSRDAYSYAAQGEMVSHHISPYLYGPNQLGNNAYTLPVDKLWGNAPPPTGRCSCSSTGSSPGSPCTTSSPPSCSCACWPSSASSSSPSACHVWPASTSGTGPSSSLSWSSTR